jgi:CubicO group peptidase (beta-lactamase class C family)
MLQFQSDPSKRERHIMPVRKTGIIVNRQLKIRLLVLVVVGVGLIKGSVAVNSWAQMPSASPAFNNEQLDKAYRFLEEAVEVGKIPGAAILVARRGIAMEPRCFGRISPEPDSPPIQPDTMFILASVTKPMTVAAVMLLVERGKISLDDPVASIIPEFGTHGKEQVTIRHLMTHTSGLPDMLPENQKLRKQHAPLEEFIRRVCNLKLGFPPGTNIEYQSMGIAILSEVVKRVEGVPLPEFMQREIFQPLGMKDTALGARGLNTDRIAHVNVGNVEMGGVNMKNQDWSWNKPYWRNFGAPWGGMFSSVVDMFRYCQMFLNEGELDGVRVFKAETIQAMVTDQTTPMETIPQSAKEQAWGLGWRLQSKYAWPTFGDLVPPRAYGHWGSTGTLVWVDPAQELICVMLTTEPDAHGILRRCASLVALSAK